MSQMNMQNMLGMTPEQMEIARKTRYAEALRRQSEEPMQGQMVSGHYVAPSWTQGLAKMLSAYGAGKMERDAANEAKRYGEQQRTDFTDTAARYAAALRGTPADTMYDPELGQNIEALPSQPGSREAALNIALQSNHPMWQQAGMQGMLKTPDAVEYSTTPQYDQSGRAFVLGKGGQIKYLDGVQARDKTEFVNGVAVNPYQVKPGTMLPDYNKPFLPDGSQNPAYQSYEVGKARAGATNVVNNISQSTEKKYGEQFAGKVAEADVGLMETAQKAPELAARANRIKQVLQSGKVITGAGADYRLAFAKAAGLVGASDSETIANTETLASDLSNNTLDAIKASGLGSGNGFSNADRDFLEKAAGGKITFDSKTLGRLADLSHRTAQLTAERWNKRAKTIPQSAIQGTGISTEPINVPTTAPTARGAKFLGFE